ncbi:MAG: penicillin-binding protein 1B [Gammaproteobacteria bacterium]
MWALLAVAAYWLWLDHEVAGTFETKQWSLPARVYARPLELYAGALLSRDRLLRELDYLGYQRVGRVDARGQYATTGQRVDLFARGFTFWDFPEPARHVSVRFSGDLVERVEDGSDGQPLDLMRLDPVEIGSINPRRFEDRKLLAYGELPHRFVEALVAVEDHRFFEHHGVDVFGLARAMVANLRARRFVQGGSTLTQQLVKNFYLTRERTLARKLTEMMMAVSLELRYDKHKILETYVNEVFLGQDGNRAIHGFELAAQFYFGAPLDELSIDQTALLVGMVKGPSVYDPRRHPEAARARRDVVLEVLARHGVLSAEELEAARDEPLRLRTGGTRATRASPAFMALVKRQLLRDYSAEDLNAAGLNVFTTLDLDLQRSAEAATRTTIDALEQDGRRSGLQAAVVVAEPRSGEILGLVGDRNPGYAGFNRALDARRPIGSTIKPLLYAYALAEPERYALFSPLADTAVSWTDAQGNNWRPKNFDNREHGRVTVLEALTRSLNLATVNLGLELGLEALRDHLAALGVDGRIEPYPSLLLGALDMSPAALAEVYTAVVNDGFRVPLRAISDVTTQEHRKLKRYGLEIAKVMEPATAALVRFAMTRVVAEGTARALRSEFATRLPLAGKTGTSDDNRDSWFVGFGANRLAVAWIGHDDNRPTGLTGSSGALRLWSAVMRHTAVEPLTMVLPPALAWQRIDTAAGVAIPAHCPQGERLPVHRDTMLERRDSCELEELLPAPVDEEPAGLLDRLRGMFGR